MAEKADVNITNLGRIERGETIPKLDSIEKIINALGISFEELFKHIQPATETTNGEKPRMLNELMERIEVHHAEKVNGVQVQKIRIHYNCIGSIEIPDVLPLPEPVVLDGLTRRRAAEKELFRTDMYLQPEIQVTNKTATLLETRWIQKKLGVTVDGSLEPKTAAAIVKKRASYGWPVGDGYTGTVTLIKKFGHINLKPPCIQTGLHGGLTSFSLRANYIMGTQGLRYSYLFYI